jgi:hypothetical protein
MQLQQTEPVKTLRPLARYELQLGCGEDAAIQLRVRYSVMRWAYMLVLLST